MVLVGKVGAARKLAAAAAYGGGGLSLLGASLYGVLTAEAKLARKMIGQLDDPGAEKCGRCDNCGGLTVTSTVSDQALTEAHDALSRPGVAISPRKMWPTALANLGIELKGKIADGAEEGRAIARLTDLGYGQQLRVLFRPGAGDGPREPG